MFFINPASGQPLAVLPFKSALKSIVRSLRRVDSVWICADSSAVKRWAARQIEANTHSDCPIEYFVKSYVACFYYFLEAGDVKLAYRCITLAFSAAAKELPPSTASRAQLLKALKHCDEQHIEFSSDIAEYFQRYSARVEHHNQKFFPNNVTYAESPRRHKVFASINPGGKYSTCTRLLSFKVAPARSINNQRELKGNSSEFACWLRTALMLAAQNASTDFCVFSLIAQHHAWLLVGDLKKAHDALWEATFLAACCDDPVSAAEKILNELVTSWYKNGHEADQIIKNHRLYLVKLSKYDGRPLSPSLLEELIDAHPGEDLHPEIKEWFQLQKQRTYGCLPHLQELAHTYQSVRSTHGQCFDAFKQVEQVFLADGEVYVDCHNQGEQKKVYFEILDATDDSTCSLVFARMGSLKKSLLDKQAPIFVDCNDYQSEQFDPGPGAYSWILAGGVWLCPSHGSIYGRSSDADNIVSCLNELKARGFDCSTVILSGRGINARVAARVALSHPNLITELILENGVFEHADHDPLIENFHTISSESPINPTALTQRVLFLSNSLNLQHFASFMQECSKENLYVGQSNNFQQSLDNVTALAFAMHTAGLVQLNPLSQLS